LNSENPSRRSLTGWPERLAPVDTGWPLAAAASLLGGAVACFALLGFKRNVAILVAVLSTLLLFAVLTALWESGELVGNVQFGMAGRPRAALIIAGTLLLCFSFLGTIRTGPAPGVLLSLGWHGLAPILGAVGTLMICSTSVPMRWGGDSGTEVSSSYLVLAGSLLGFLLLSTGAVMYAGGSIPLQEIKGWLLLLALFSGLASILGEYASSSRRWAARR